MVLFMMNLERTKQSRLIDYKNASFPVADDLIKDPKSWAYGLDINLAKQVGSWFLDYMQYAKLKWIIWAQHHLNMH